MSNIRVLDQEGKALSPCSADKAQKMLAEGRAVLVSEEPATIRLTYTVELPAQRKERRVGEGKRILLHVCCGPCATYTIQRLRQHGFEVAGFWYNPNVHPFAEHEARRVSLDGYLKSVGVPLVGENGYQMLQFLRLVVGTEARGARCRYCYELRLSRTAKAAVKQGFDAFTTTLLISPHQDQGLLREIGQRVAGQHGVEFYFENFRRGWAEGGRLAHQHGLYRQQYCGCIYSEWERHAGLDVCTPLSEGGRE